MELGIFNQVQIVLDADKEKKDGLIYKIKADEKPLIGTSIEIDTSSSHSIGAIIGISAVNPIGFAEKVTMKRGVDYSFKNPFASLEFKFPYLPIPGSLLFAITSRRYDFTEESSINLSSNQANLTYKSSNNNHQISLITSLRDVLPLPNQDNIDFKYNTSKEYKYIFCFIYYRIMKNLQSTVKNSISYSYTKDMRDSKDSPSQGYMFNCYSVYI